MPEKGKNILKYNHGGKSMKFFFIFYAETDSLVGKIDTCHNNPEQSTKTKINMHIPCG